MVAKSIAKIYTNIHKPTDYNAGNMLTFVGLSCIITPVKHFS